MSHSDDRMVIRVHPEPDDDEMAAIVSALTALVSRHEGEEPAREDGGGRARWAQAGRRELLRPFARENGALRAY